MRWVPIAKPGSWWLVGKLRNYQPANGRLSSFSDLVVLGDARDGTGALRGDLVVAERDILVLPDNMAACHAASVIAEYRDPGFDNLQWLFAYGRIVDSFSVPSRRETAGYVVEITQLPDRPYSDAPALGELAIVTKDSMYQETETTAFVRVARSTHEHFDYGYYARAVVL